jgi:hypothetical protein
MDRIQVLHTAPQKRDATARIFSGKNQRQLIIGYLDSASIGDEVFVTVLSIGGLHCICGKKRILLDALKKHTLRTLFDMQGD